ncbi:hypothetical protein GCM10017620_31280 [Brevundimonas intermedia]|uniref:Flagellar motor switch protein FliN-like C-terminal domain-containing protein n=1 Tax=Brevundimonas intermedia TaxID=74315 RepID=A0ABQ5TBG0_9CAUL|nr:FliM/FliN family flagellar motor switch protein [Brevundimonas intermedia]GLK50154.1 hypothetical protein GCM10017620_31280 [Brevundimonas intermedia]
MTSPVWRWAPDRALLDEGTLGWLDGIIAAWSDRWFAQGRVRRRGLERSTGASASTSLFAARASLETSPAQRDHLAELALDIEVARLEATPADQALLDGLVETAVADLTRAVEAAIGGDAADPALALGGPSGRVVFPLSDETGRLVGALAVARASLVQARLGALAPPAPASAPLVAMSAAIADTPVTLTVHAGTALLSLAEARELGVGDVVVLDRALDAAFDLLSAAHPEPIARAALIDAVAPQTLRLISA